MTPTELETSELNFDRLKPDRENFIHRYGKDAEKVMRSVAIKQAKNMNKNKIREMVRTALTIPKQEEINSEAYLSSRKQMEEAFNPTDIIKMDVPLFLRMLEYAREDAKTDMDLHDVTEMATSLSGGGKTLTMSDYDTIVGGGAELDEKKLTSAEKRKKEEIVKGMKKSFKGDEGAMYAIATAKAKELAEDYGSIPLMHNFIPGDDSLKTYVNILIKDPKISSASTEQEFRALLRDKVEKAHFFGNKDEISRTAEGVLSFNNTERYNNVISRIWDIMKNTKEVEEGLPKDYWAKKIPGGKMEESSNLTKQLRKLGWHGETWTPKEFANQIKNLSDETLISWAKSNKGIPNTPLAFQQKLVKIEMEKRGLNNEKVNESFKQLVGKLKKQGKSGKAATSIAGAVASYKAKGGGKGPTAKQKARMAEIILSKLKGE